MKINKADFPKSQRMQVWNLKKGEKFAVVSVSNSHNYPLFTVLTMKNDGLGSSSMNNVAVECTGNDLMAKDCIVINKTLDMLLEERNSLKDEIINLETKIKFMKHHNLTEFDGELIKIYDILGVVEEEDDTKMDKALKIYKLLQ